MSRAKIASLTPAMWHVVDAKEQVVGRLAPQIARLLMGKHKPTFSPHMDSGDYVVVINARHVAFTGKKATDKLYRWHTGWMGGLKTLTARQMMERDPRRVLQLAIKGMMPKNPLRDERMYRLRVFPDGEHEHGAQVEQSRAFASEHLTLSTPKQVTKRPAPETGALVVNASATMSKEEIGDIKWTKLEHDEAFAQQYDDFLAKQARTRAVYSAAYDAHVVARAQELDAAELAAVGKSPGPTTAAVSLGARIAAKLGAKEKQMR